ncbi:hypothetical protein [Zavarzinella formosa]|uniref:hypothetical protein n=1 Tax=Zavarzinella formosa TaxID=360055 RepID=UPI00030AA77A|nr:hypothetical protein [Zavarzinella formosa]
MSAVKLPKKLTGRLDELASRVRHITVYRAVARALFLLPATALVLILADAYLGFSSSMRLGLLGCWCLLVVREVMNLRWAMKVPIDAETIAHAIETEYPRMGERLTTAVELSRHADESNGSPELIREVIRDAQTRAERLDFERVFPKTAAVRGLWTALLAFIVIALPLALVSSAREYAGRFFAPWHVPTVAVDYRVIVTSKDPAVKRGDAVTLSGYVEATKAGTALPGSATLVIDPSGHGPKDDSRGTTLPDSATLVITANGREDRIPMTADESNIYRVKRPSVEGDFDYRIESGLAVSETHHVTMVEPVTLSKARLTITPPAYARTANDTPTVIEGLGELTALEHGTIQFDLQFSPHPKAVTLEFSPEMGDKTAKKKQTIVTNDQGRASIIWPARQSGMFQLIAEGERGVKSELPAQPLRVIADESPKFPRVVGLHERRRNIRPTELLKIDCTATDDIAVSKLALEYRINDGPVQTKVIDSPTLNTTQADGKISWNISEIAKSGDILEVRLVATDNRRVPEVMLEPQTTRYPAKDWSEFLLREDAAPLAEQDITQRKAEIDAKLTAIRDELKAESRTTYSLRKELANKKNVSPDENKKLNNVRDDLERTANKLRDLAEDTGVTPELRKLAEAMRNLEENELRTGTQSLSSAKEATASPERNKNLSTADEALENALKKVDELLAENERIAKERLDKMKLKDLAAEQQELADKAKAADAKQADELKKKQEEVQSKLKQLQDQSEAIKKAIEAAKADEANKLAREAERLAKEIQELNKAMEKTDNNATAGKLEDLKKKQEELTKKAQEFGNQTDNASRAAQAAPLKADDAAKKALDKGDLDEAAKQQEKAAQELDRLARELENAAAKTRNPREAAKQLAQLQENLRQKLAQETQVIPFAQIPKTEQEAITKQQDAIEKATAKLKTPEGDTGAEVAKQRAASDAKKAGEALKQQSAEMADRRMQDAKKSLEQLAAKLPTDEQRLAKAKEEINKLKEEQEKLRKETEQAAKNNADKPDELRKKLAEAAKKEAELTEKLKKTDTPGQERRQEKTAEAMEKAASDLTHGKPEDIAKSQQAAKQELERLEQALNGKPQPEPKTDTPPKTPGENADNADQLARKQRELADTTNKAEENLKGKTGDEAEKAKKEAKADLNRQQEELTKQLGQLGGTDAPKDRQQAEQSMADAKMELDRENFEGAVKKQREAAEALDRLSREARQEEARQQSERNADLPNQEQANAAKRLAQEQRQLRDEAMKAQDELNKQNARKDNPAGELAKEQERIAKEAQDLARKSADRQGEQAEATKQANEAAKAAEQGAKKLQNGELPDAQKSGEQAKESMDKLAKDNPGTESGQKAKELAQRQDDVNKKLGELTKDAGAAKAQQQAREKDLAEQAGKLGEQLDQMAREGMQPNGSAKQAGQDAKKAGEQMKAAQQADQKNQAGQAKDSRDKAAKSLEQAAKGAREGAKPGDMKPDGSPQAGDAVQKADQQMNQAGQQLGKGKPGEASARMQDAARSLDQAANQLGQPQPGDANKPGEAQRGDGPIPVGAPGGPGGTPDLRNFAPDIAKHNGKPWGELPGEIRTKIIQQMSARYGEDYARNIKLYFEQLAERK